MEIFSSCRDAVKACTERRTFTVARLYSDEKTMDMHIHDCYEIYVSLSGGKQFLIGERSYDIEPGDVFVINNYESHYLSRVERQAHERVVLSVWPEYLEALSSPATDLKACFRREGGYGNRIRPGRGNRDLLRLALGRLTQTGGYGADLLERAAFTELMVLVNRLYREQNEQKSSVLSRYNPLVDRILTYINRHITESLSVSSLARQFFVSESYICRVFKSEAGTTIHKYLTARRIGIAKTLLAGGASVSEACEGSGFNDYSNFVKCFTKAVGAPPRRYGRYGA